MRIVLYLVNNGEDGDLRRHRAHYDVTIMILWYIFHLVKTGHELNKFEWYLNVSHHWVLCVRELVFGVSDLQLGTTDTLMVDPRYDFLK